MDLVKFLYPKHVILVHGEKPKMATLKERIQSELAIQCYYPANNETLRIPSTHHIEAGASDAFLQSCLCPNFKLLKTNPTQESDAQDTNKRTMPLLQVCEYRVAQGLITVQKDQSPQVVSQDELMDVIGAKIHEQKFTYCCPIVHSPESLSRDASDCSPSKPCIAALLHLIFETLSTEFPDSNVQDCQEYIQIQSFVVSFCSKEKCRHRTDDSSHSASETVHFCCSWLVADEELAWKAISTMKNLELRDAPSLKRCCSR